MRAIVTLFLLSFCCGCAGHAEIPDWLASEPADYPASGYLSGRGQGETAGLARDRARSDLAKIFEVAVHESSSDRLQWQQGGAAPAGLQASVSRDLLLQTSQVISGIRIAQTWRAAAGGDFHALAILDRRQAANLLRAEIAALDQQTAQNLTRARSEERLPEKVSAAYNALNAQLRRQHPQKMLQIVDQTGTGLPSKYQSAELQRDFEGLLDRWQIGLRVARDELGGIDELLAGALANAGIRYLAGETRADYLLQATLDSEKLASADGWFWVRGTLHITLRETTGGNVIGSRLWPYKSSARQAEMAEIRARAQLAGLLNDELLGALVECGVVDASRAER